MTLILQEEGAMNRASTMNLVCEDVASNVGAQFIAPFLSQTNYAWCGNYVWVVGRICRPPRGFACRQCLGTRQPLAHRHWSGMGAVMSQPQHRSSQSQHPAQPAASPTHPKDTRQQQEQQAKQSTDDQRSGKQKAMEDTMRKADVGGK